ncbi:MAG: hypothetical protein V3U65_05460 [Granulosicoccaceae bacterium]
MVVFIGDNAFKTDMPDNVTNGHGSIRYIKSKSDEVLSDEPMENWFAKIEADKQNLSIKTNREHIKLVSKS